MSDSTEGRLLALIDSRQAKIGIMGLGYVGLPLARAFAEAGFTVLGFDTDPDQGIASRVKTLDMLESERMPVLVYHFPWPGIGHISKDGEGYRYHPAPMRVVAE